MNMGSSMGSSMTTSNSTASMDPETMTTVCLYDRVRTFTFLLRHTNPPSWLPASGISRIGASSIWFTGWTPASVGANVGACVGLFFLAVASRALARFSASCDAAWSRRLAPPAGSRPGSIGSYDTKLVGEAASAPPRAPRFLPAVEVPRGVLFTFSVALSYFLMLAVMTSNVWFFVAIVLGLRAGQIAFGRFSAGGSGMAH